MHTRCSLLRARAPGLGVLLLLACAGGAKARAQVGPTYGLTVGGHINQRVNRDPFVSSRQVDENHALVATATAGVILSPIWTADVRGRTSLGPGRPFRSLDAGISGSARVWGRPHVRLAAGALRAYQTLLCVAGTGCTVVHRPEGWELGVDLSVGLQTRFGARSALGPVFWFTRSVQRDPEYRSIGFGVRFTRLPG